MNPTRGGTLSSKADLHIFSKLVDHGFDEGFKAEAFRVKIHRANSHVSRPTRGSFLASCKVGNA